LLLSTIPQYSGNSSGWLEQAEQALEEEQADMVAIGRGLIADPELVTKTLEGRSDEVVECTDCLQCYMPGEEPGTTCQVNDIY
jgi:2,4-dienoyl-CoA reductase (NADPH2)